MKTSIFEGRHGIQWTSRNRLDNSDLPDDLALLSHTHERMQVKTTSVAVASAPVDFHIHKGIIKILRFNTENINPIILHGEALEVEEFFTYMGSIDDERVGSNADVKAKIGKAKTEFLQLKNICNSKQQSVNQYQS
ncbi:unnamed protein product [Schistosoma curassoni]|uniref:BTB domain-containing protein n=1 Tax=Schistosoma curassoni TaxID=6186 RepID=A0A183KSH9_9TREM|nr:unnamed protein product [Schistosoma curassoni]